MRIIKQDILVYISASGIYYIDWYKNNRIHREDGPAEIWDDNIEYYYLDNKFYSEEEYWKEVHENY